MNQVNQYLLTAAGQAELGRLIGKKVAVRLVQDSDHFYSDGATVGAVYAMKIGESTWFYLNAGGAIHWNTASEFDAVATTIQEFILNACG
jgi:hypothetical protein